MVLLQKTSILYVPQMAYMVSLCFVLLFLYHPYSRTRVMHSPKCIGVVSLLLSQSWNRPSACDLSLKDMWNWPHITPTKHGKWHNQWIREVKFADTRVQQKGKFMYDAWVALIKIKHHVIIYWFTGTWRYQPDHVSIGLIFALFKHIITGWQTNDEKVSKWLVSQHDQPHLSIACPNNINTSHIYFLRESWARLV